MNITPFTFRCGGCLIKADRERKTIRKKRKRKGEIRWKDVYKRQMQDGELKTTDELLKTALRYKSYWKDKGGITVSGGEPLMQMDFLIDLFKKAKEQGCSAAWCCRRVPCSTPPPSIRCRPRAPTS